MGDFLRLILDSLQYIWPLRIVHQWEKAGYYVFGRCIWIVGPGLYPVVPWFMDVKTVSIAGARVGTGRQDLTLTDGSTLSYSATAWACVTDPELALNAVDSYGATTAETLASILSDKLIEINPDRLRPGRRDTLFKSLEALVQEETATYGVTISKLCFPSFILNVKTHRLLIDQTAPAPW